MHAHIIYGFGGEGFQKYFGLGVGGEVLFTEDPHFGLMASIAIYPYHGWEVLVSPGVEIANHDGGYESVFAMHYEITYGFEVGEFHLGPVVGFAHGGGREHYSVGLHFGF